MKPRKRRLKVLSVRFCKRWLQPLAVLVEECPVVCLEECPVGCPEECPVGCQEECLAVSVVLVLLQHRVLVLLMMWMMVPTLRRLINNFLYCVKTSKFSLFEIFME